MHFIGSSSAASLGVVVFAVALYANSLHGDFVFDDHPAIQVNPDVRNRASLSSVFSNDYWGLPLGDPESHKSYRPLTVLSFKINHYFHGLWSPGFHAVNIAVHGLICVLLFGSCLNYGVGLWSSLCTSLLFASHPIHTEAVSNIVGRSELLAGIFFLLALLSYLRSRRSRNDRFVIFWMILAVVLAAVAMLCKEQGVTVLGLCAASEILASFSKPSLKMNIKKTKRRIVIRLLILISAIPILLYVRIYLIGGGGTPKFIDSDNPAAFSPSFQTRFLTYTYIWSFNIWLLLCPSWLCHDWSMGSIPLVESISDPRATVSIVSLAVTSLGGALLIYRVFGNYSKKCSTAEYPQAQLCIHGNMNLNNNTSLMLQTITCTSSFTGKKPSSYSALKGTTTGSQWVVLVAMAWVVIPFLPASNLFFPVGFVVAERVLYLPSMGFCLLAALGINSIAAKFGKKYAILGLFLLLLIFSTKTLVRNAEWRNTESVVNSALKINPRNAKIHMSMGNVLAQRGDKGCEVFYRNAVILRPKYSSAWANLGLVLVNTGRAEEAESAYLKALLHKPDHINANTNMGHLCRMQERWKEALHHFTMALNRRPTIPNLHYFAGMASEKLGDYQRAVEEYGEAIKYKPDYVEAHRDLGRLLASDSDFNKQKLEKALYHYQRSANLKPEDKEIQQELRNILKRRHRSTEKVQN